MNQIKLTYGMKSFSFCMNSLKVVYGIDYEKKFEMVQMIRQYMNKSGESEYQAEYNNQPKLYFNEREIEQRKWSYFELHPYFDLQTDLKLGAKSIGIAFIDALLANLDYSDHINTANILLRSAIDEVNERLEKVIHTCSKLNLSIQDINRKSLVKSIELQLISDQLYQSVTDLTFDDYIILIIDMLVFIAENNNTKMYLIIIDLPSVSNRIQERLSELEKSSASTNINLLFITQSYFETTPTNYVIVAKHVTDLANDNQIIENYINNISWRANVEEIVNEFYHIIKNEHTQNSLELIDLM